MIAFSRVVWTIPLLLVAVASPAMADCQPGQFPIRFQDAEIQVGLWSRGDSVPACLDGDARGLSALVQVDAVVPDLTDGTEVMARVARVSAYPSIRYWSPTRERWRELVVSASPLDSRDGPDRGGDFDLTQLWPGRTIHIHQDENTPAGDVVYAMTIEQWNPDRLTLRAVNATAVTRLGLTLLDPGEYEVRHEFRRVGEGWIYRGQLRVAGAGVPFLQERAESLMTRMVALYRYLAGRPAETPLPSRVAP